jgi:hypothetical protein
VVAAKGARVVERDDVVELDQGWMIWDYAALRGSGVPFEVLADLALPDQIGLPPSPARNEAIRAANNRAFDSLVRNDTVREAITWQNPGVARTWLTHYAEQLRTGIFTARKSARGYREGVLARYAQRYATKNESVGFFGPVAWADVCHDSSEFPQKGLVQTGSGGIRRRTAYLETWAVAALAEAFAAVDGVADLVPLRWNPATALVDGQVRRPRRPPQPAGPADVAVLRAVDGVRCRGEVLATAAITHPVPDELVAALQRWEKAGVLLVGFRVPHHDRPDAVLRQQIVGLPDPALREDLLARLDSVTAACRRAGEAVGPDAVRQALDEVSRSVEAAGFAVAENRHTDFGRTPVYLECTRDTDVIIGSDLVDALRAPLALLLDTARWLCAEVATTVEAGLIAVYHQLRTRGEVTLADLQLAAVDYLVTGGPELPAVTADFQARWAELLTLADTDRDLRLDSARIRPMVDALFPHRRLHWAASRQHSPDLLLGRTADGGYRWVLGELHISLNTLESRTFLTQCDQPERLLTATERDMDRGRVMPVYPLNAAGATSRTYPPAALDPPGRYHYWSYDRDDGRADAARSVPATAVRVNLHDGVLVGTALGSSGRAEADAGWSAPVLEFFGDFLTSIAVNLFQIRPKAPHRPRVWLDDVIIARESWTFAVSEVPLPRPESTDRGHTPTVRWATATRLPRHVFAMVQGERKPVYVDFAAPLLVANLVHSLRRAEPDATVTISEMLPDPDELWLSDDAGHHYTSEFRIVAVDQQFAAPDIRKVP